MRLDDENPSERRAIGLSLAILSGTSILVAVIFGTMWIGFIVVAVAAMWLLVLWCFAHVAALFIRTVWRRTATNAGSRQSQTRTRPTEHLHGDLTLDDLTWAGWLSLFIAIAITLVLGLPLTNYLASQLPEIQPMRSVGTELLAKAIILPLGIIFFFGVSAFAALFGVRTINRNANGK